MTYSERKWLMEQMASQRRKPEPSAESTEEGEVAPIEASAPGAPAPPSSSPPEPSPNPARHEGQVRRHHPRGTIDSFWSFG